MIATNNIDFDFGGHPPSLLGYGMFNSTRDPGVPLFLWRFTKMSSERPIAPTIAAKDENQQPLWNSHAEKPSLLPKKLRILSDSERSELFRIDELIEQLHSGAFCQGIP